MIKPADFRLLGIAVVLFGLAWPITKHAMQDATPLWFATARSLGAAAMAFAFLALSRRLVWPMRRDWPTILGVGFFQLAVFFALAHLAVMLTSAGRTAVLANVITPWLVPLSVLLLHEKVSPRRWLAAGLGVAGVVALAGPWAVDWTSPAALVGNGMLLLAALSWTIAILITRLYPPAQPIVSLLPWCFAVSAAFLTPLALWREPHGGIGPGAYLHAAWIALIVAPLGTWSVIEVGRRLPSTIASAGLLMVPVVGVASAAIWLGEPIGMDIISGGVLIAAGVLVAARS
ncbi:DMT family transporter [Humitalea sp. 24SJ18S-53]|uniref:DMT family transporter n=1 Tax=Humitalea sp. 24SJ18S-53 TaxID=3422307 RepID=UPI003D66F323